MGLRSPCVSSSHLSTRLTSVICAAQILEVVSVAFEPLSVEDVFTITGMSSLSLHARSNILAKLSAVLVTLRGKFVPYVGG